MPRFAALLAALFVLPTILCSPMAARAGEADWKELGRKASLAYEQGRFAEALPPAREALQQARTTFGEDSARTASSAGNLALILERSGRYEEAETWARRALAIAEAALGPEHPDTADSLQLLAAVLHSRGRYREAEPLYRRAAAIFQNTLGPGHPATARCLSGYALLLNDLARPQEAAGLAQGAAAALRTALGDADPNTAIAADNYAAVLRAQGRYADAEVESRRALAALERSAGPAHPFTLNASGSLAAAIAAQGRYEEAETRYRQNLALVEQSLGAGHPSHAAASSILASVLREQGRYAEAERLYRVALAGLEAALGANHPDTTTALQSLAGIVKEQGRYSEAEAMYRNVVANFETALGKDHPRLAAAYAGYGWLLETQARYGEAEPLYRRALVIEEATYGFAHPDVANISLNMAVLLRKQGRYAEALAYYAQATAIWEKALGRDYPLISGCLAGMGVIHLKKNEAAQAEPLLRRAADIRERAFGAEHPATAIALNYLAQSLEAQGKEGEAEALFQRAAAISVDAGEPVYRVLHDQGLGRFLVKHARLEEALPVFLRAVDTLDWLFSQTRQQSDETRYTFLGQFADVYQDLIALLLQLHERNPAAGYDRQVLAAVSRNQSRIFSEMLRQADVGRFTGEPAFVDLKKDRDQLLSQIASLRENRMSVAAAQSGARLRQQLLARAMASMEARLASVNAALERDYPRFMQLVAPRPVTVDGLQASLLRPGEALLAYASLERELLVIAVTRDRFSLKRVALPRAELSSQVFGVRRAIARAGADLALLRTLDPQQLSGLYRSLIEPVRGVIDGSTRVLVIADGPLYTLPFEMLVTRYDAADSRAFSDARRAADGHAQTPLFGEYGLLAYFGEHNSVTYYPSLAALVSQRLHPRARAAVRRDLIAFADPVFAEEAGARAAPTAGAYSASTRAALEVMTRSLRQDVTNLLPRLPETAEEARSIATILPGESAVYLREQAQERRLKTLDLTGVRYLLFATHGLLGGEILPGTGLAGRESLRGGQYVDATAESPAQPALVLTLTGELEGEDGLLTMRDVIEDLNLDVDLAVLSACNTAGNPEEADRGEGFAGLSRAFLYAGARQLLVSHWPVESGATRDLMIEAFRGLQGGLASGQALAAARAKLRQSAARAPEGALFYSRSHPFFWAPFVLVGD